MMDGNIDMPRGIKRRGRLPSGQPHPIDVHVGGRVRLRRLLLGMSQERLAEGLGLTFQQVQKYERGANRMGASRLYQVGRVLDVPIAYFFEEFEDGGPRVPVPASIAEKAAEYQDDLMTRRETLDLIRAYYRITDPKVRRKVFDMIRALATDTVE